MQSTNHPTKDPQNWIEGAKSELAQLLREIGELDARRQRAQLLHQVLSLLGTKPAALPWRRHGPRPKANQ